MDGVGTSDPEIVVRVDRYRPGIRCDNPGVVDDAFVSGGSNPTIRIDRTGIAPGKNDVSRT